ncbi:MAG: hypothetical protein ACLR76_06400 [Alistipes sp.]
MLFYDSKPSPMLLIKLRAVTACSRPRPGEIAGADAGQRLAADALFVGHGESVRRFAEVQDQVLIGGIVTLLFR